MIVQAPINIMVQWDEVDQEVRTIDGQIVAIEATALVNEDIKVGSVIVLGTLDDWGSIGTGSAGTAGPLYEVVKRTKIPDIDNRNYERMIKLARYKNVLPPSVEV